MRKLKKSEQSFEPAKDEELEALQGTSPPILGAETDEVLVDQEPFEDEPSYKDIRDYEDYNRRYVAPNRSRERAIITCLTICVCILCLILAAGIGAAIGVVVGRRSAGKPTASSPSAPVVAPSAAPLAPAPSPS